MSFQLVGFNSGNYANFAEATNLGAIYETGSTIDCLEGRCGVYDMEEVCGMFTSMSGDTGFVFGVVSDKGNFHTLDAITTVFSTDDCDNYETSEAIEYLEAQDAKSIFDAIDNCPNNYRTICISTGHLSPSDEKALDKLTEVHETVFKRDSGWIVKLVADEPFLDQFLESGDWTGKGQLRKILAGVYSSEYVAVEFDADGDELDGLEFYSLEFVVVPDQESADKLASEHIEPDPMFKEIKIGKGAPTGAAHEVLNPKGTDTRKGITVEGLLDAIESQITLYGDSAVITVKGYNNNVEGIWFNYNKPVYDHIGYKLSSLQFVSPYTLYDMASDIKSDVRRGNSTMGTVITQVNPKNKMWEIGIMTDEGFISTLSCEEIK